MQPKRLLLPICLLAVSAAAFAYAPLDSVGVERKGKNTWVLHKVAYGETLFSLARRYHASVGRIKTDNPGLGDALNVGDIVKVPYQHQDAKNTADSRPAGGRTHTVANGEGLYAIARRYGVSVADLRRWNGLASDELRIGTELVVSRAGNAPAPSPVTAARPAADKPAADSRPAGGRTHTVANGEGLYAIARRYGVSVADLRRWNGLASDELRIGTELVVAAPAESVVTPVVAKAENRPAAEPVRTAAPPDTKPAENTVASAETTAAVRPETIGNKIEDKPAAPLVVNNSGYVKTVESGMAEAITDGASSDLFLALHRTAPVGTIMQVRNEMNDQSVFVKVIGKLPDTGENDRVIVKLSRRAYERLAAVDRRFRVQLSYMPQQ